jgi:hypothetical protein
MANIEAEGGETVLGDINNDGNIEHMTITGKRHTQGGVPLQIPPGSFVFSDTNKMKIKDPAVLKHFGMGGKTGGYTPAAIAKQYQLNDFMKKVNDPKSDPLTRRTAEMMLNNNMQKLSELAAYQEGMKGKQPPAVSQQMLPDGGQQMSQTAQPPMMEDPAMMQQMMMQQQGQPEMDELEMAYGGMIKMQNAGTVPPKVGSVYYINGQPIKLARYEDDSWTDYLTPNFMADPGGAYFKGNNGEEYYLNFDQFKDLRSNKKIITDGSKASSWWTGDGMKKFEFSTTPGGTIPGIQADNQNFNVGDQITTRSGTFKVVNPQYLPHPNPLYNFMQVMDEKGKLTTLSVKAVIEDVKKGLGEIQSIKGAAQTQGETSEGLDTSDLSKTKSQSPKPVNVRTIYSPEGKAIQWSAKVSAPPGYMEANEFNAQFNSKKTSGNNPGGTPKTLPKKIPSKVKVYDNVDDMINDKWQELQDHAMGGNIYADGGSIAEPQYRYDPVQRRMVPVMQTAGTVPANDGEKEFVEEYELKGKGKVKRVTQGNVIKVVDKDGTVLSEKKITADSAAYDPAAIDEYKKQGIKVVLPKQFENSYANVMIPGRQGQRGNSGTFGKNDYWGGDYKADFESRFSGFIKQNPDFNPAKNKEDGRFQNYYNNHIREVGNKLKWSEDKIQAEIKKHGFIEGSKGPNKFDKQFGEYTWSRPTYDIDEQPPAPVVASPKTVYRCPDCQPVQITGEPAAGDYESQAKCHTECASVKAIPGQKPAAPQDMWLQDKVSMAAVAGMDPYYGNPAMFQTNLMGANPQLEEYSAKNAAIQSNASMAASQINQSADPTAARANIAAIVGQSNQQGLNEIANIQNRNVNTTNDFAKFNAGIQNQENASNTQLRKQFFDETNVYGQNLQNFENQKEMQMANAFNRGVQGIQNRNMFRAIYPQYDVDPNSGAYRFNEGMDFTNPSVGYATTGASSQNMGELVNYYKKQLEGSVAPDKLDDAAIKFAEKHMASQQQNANIDHRAALRANPGMALSGMTGGYNPF